MIGINTCIYKDHCSLHAEYNLIINLRNKYITNNEVIESNGKYILFVFRFNRHGDFVMAKPCKSCASLIYTQQYIKKIYFTTGQGIIDNVSRANILFNAQLLRFQETFGEMNLTLHRKRFKTTKTIAIKDEKKNKDKE